MVPYWIARTKTYLDKTGVISCDDQFAIASDGSTSCDIFESWYCFCYFLSTWCVYLYASGCSDSISVRFYGREVYRSDRSVFFYEYWMFELSPITRFSWSFWWRWLWMFLDHDRLVVHCQRGKMFDRCHVRPSRFNKILNRFDLIIPSFCHPPPPPSPPPPSIPVSHHVVVQWCYLRRWDVLRRFPCVCPHLVNSVLRYWSSDRKLVDDIVYEVNCQLITVKAGADVDIGELNETFQFVYSFH